MTIPNVSPLERAQELMISTLNANLAAEVTLINTESGGDTTLAAPPSVDYFEAVESGENVIVEAVPTSIIPLEVHPTEWDKGRITTDVIVDVAVTLRRADWSDQDYMRQLNRYGAALIRTITLKNNRLGDPTNVINVFWEGPVRYEVDPETDEGGRLIRRIVVPFRVKLQERL